MAIRTFDSNINYKNAKLSRKTPLKQKIACGITALFLSASAISFIISPFIETPITGYTFDGYNLENAVRNGNTYDLYYKDANFQLSFDELQKQYNQNERYCIDLDNNHAAFITPVIDNSAQNKVLCIGLFSLVIGASPMIAQIERNKKSKQTRKR